MALLLRFLRVGTGLFFLATGLFIGFSLLTGLGGPPRQPTPEAQAFMDSLSSSGFIDPLLGAGFVVGGGALLWRRTTPLGLVLLAPAVLVILFFHLLLSGQWLVGIVTFAVWAILAFTERQRLSVLWRREDERC